jgi:hypothetical protein
MEEMRRRRGEGGKILALFLSFFRSELSTPGVIHGCPNLLAAAGLSCLAASIIVCREIQFLIEWEHKS